MEFSLLALIGISLATMFFGYFFGLFEGRGQGYRRGRKEEGLSHAQEHSPVAPDLHSRPSEDGTSSLLVLEQDRTGKPLVKIDGQPVNASAVSQEVRRRLIELMVMLRPWIEPSGSTAQSAPVAVAGQAPTTALRDAAPSAAAAASREPSAQEPAAFTAAQSTAGMSLVQQIDQVLQARLAGTSLAGRGIRLAEAPHGGAIVFIGQNQYDGVDKVVDPEIQGAIRSAIAEWEKRYAPG